MIIYHVVFLHIVPKNLDLDAYQKALEILQKESGPGKYGKGESYRDLLEKLIRKFLF